MLNIFRYLDISFCLEFKIDCPKIMKGLQKQKEIKIHPVTAIIKKQNTTSCYIFSLYKDTIYNTILFNGSLEVDTGKTSSWLPPIK